MKEEDHIDSFKVCWSSTNKEPHIDIDVVDRGCGELSD